MSVRRRAGAARARGCGARAQSKCRGAVRGQSYYDEDSRGDGILGGRVGRRRRLATHLAARTPTRRPRETALSAAGRLAARSAAANAAATGAPCAVWWVSQTRHHAPSTSPTATPVRHPRGTSPPSRPLGESGSRGLLMRCGTVALGQTYFVLTLYRWIRERVMVVPVAVRSVLEIRSFSSESSAAAKLSPIRPRSRSQK